MLAQGQQSWGGNVQIPVLALTVPLPLSPDFGVSYFPTIRMGRPQHALCSSSDFSWCTYGAPDILPHA